MKNDLITAKECISRFKEVGLEVKESYFSKQKKRGVFQTYRQKGSSRDWFDWINVGEQFILSFSPKTQKDETALFLLVKEIEKCKNKKALQQKIDEVWKEIYQCVSIEIIFDMFENVGETLFNETQEILKEAQAKGEAMHQDFINEFSKTKEDHIGEFKAALEYANDENTHRYDLLEGLLIELSRQYKEFDGSYFEYSILAIAKDFFNTPLSLSEEYGIELVENSPSANEKK